MAPNFDFYGLWAIPNLNSIENLGGFSLTLPGLGVFIRGDGTGLQQLSL